MYRSIFMRDESLISCCAKRNFSQAKQLRLATRRTKNVWSSHSTNCVTSETCSPKPNSTTCSSTINYSTRSRAARCASRVARPSSHCSHGATSVAYVSKRYVKSACAPCSSRLLVPSWRPRMSRLRVQLICLYSNYNPRHHLHRRRIFQALINIE